MTETARILVVDDERIIALAVSKMLEDRGFEAAGIASTGPDAVKQTDSLRPDLVLMDVNLGGVMDGIDVAEIIREHYGIPVVFITAYADDPTLLRAREVTPYGYLVKPVDEHQLNATVQMALVRRRVELASLQAALA